MNKQRSLFLIGVMLTAFDFLTEINTLVKELKWLCCRDVNLYCGHNPLVDPDNGYLYSGGDSRCEIHKFACTMPFTEDQCFLETSRKDTCEYCMEDVDGQSTSEMRDDYTGTYRVVRSMAILTFVLALCKESYKAYLVLCILFKDNLKWEKTIIDSASIILIYIFRPSLWKQLLDFVDKSKTSGELEHFRRLLSNLFLEDIPSIATAIFVLRNFTDDDGNDFYAYLSLIASAAFIAYTIYLIRRSDQAYATNTTTTRELGTGKQSATESNSGDVKSNLIIEEACL